MKTRFGIIGLGAIANRFASVLNTMEEIELAAVASRDNQKAAEFAEKYHATKAYTKYEDLILDEKVEVIYVALTHNFHYEIVKKCLENKKAVICEKPLVLNQKHAQELVELSKKNNTVLMEAMWTRCLPAFQKAKEWTLGGSIGKIKLIQASFCFNAPFNEENRLYKPDLAGGSLYDAGVYPIEFVTGILDENPIYTNGVASICKTGVDDVTAVNFGFKSGALATISSGISVNTSSDAYIYGSEGHIVVYDFLRTRKCERYDKSNQLVETFEGIDEDGFIYQIREVCRLYHDHKIESELISHRDSIACAEVFDILMAQFEEQRVESASN
ncbi:Gfo/Idh/MocA family protein [Scatolibacter rhodanostii]|uniref:Gfo/Idh/MocA family protein n=1 Tax=Scatolibacter rhodanostii TaxID=2014781 RepID=UPI000C0734DD|nr:Gfo/Idh/MocA family oxidoreductase [Scatolibacter rhodanostii]